MDTIRITTSQNIDIDYEFAGLGERILAYLIDFGILIILLISGMILENMVPSIKIKDISIITFIWLLIYALYDIVCETCFNGQSLGKRIMKIKVISLDGSQPTIGQYVMRWLFRIVDFSITAMLGALISTVVTQKKQRIGDIAAGTALIRTHPRTAFHQVAFAPVEEGYQPIFSEAIRLSNAEVVLIHQVINNVKRTDNFPLLHQMAVRLKQHLNIVAPQGMDDQLFLETLIKDYNYANVTIEA